MKIEITILLIFFAVSICALHQQNLWPLPNSANIGTDQFTLDPTTFQFTAVGYKSPILTLSFQRYKNLVFLNFEGEPPSKSESVLSSLLVNVTTADEDLDLFTKEQYSLRIEANGNAILVAETVYGALRGLETFSQLVYTSVGNPVSYIINAPLYIVDEPAFRYRGLMIDTARHFMSVSFITQILDAMSYSKLNVLHWHITDDESFPIESVTYPLLTKAAFSPQEIYSQADAKSIVEYARNLGIRVIPEFDVPGHTTAWGKGYPQLMVATCTEGILNPTLNFTYQLLEGFLTEMAKIFPDAYFHLGGDEVNDHCWLNDPQVSEWMDLHGMTTFAQLEQYFVDQVQAIAVKLKKTVINWQEVFDNGVKSAPTNVIEVWKSSDIKNITSAGYTAITSYKWYLNHGCNLYGDALWDSFYKVDITAGLNLVEKQRLLGGEAAMWNGCVDETNWEPTVWPRAAATAARLWEYTTSTIPDAESRIHLHRCRLLERGINASPVAPGTCVGA
eukprot:TRINITY_DN1117_c0_g1_i1.p1 TRINITY_DN1117_c0_g1~~TRINITY_DN1117_c0_g1_i1.p1  ORF type:complete len:504 (+),score=75.38 TRINITY_DN1117_c0_g1_i1:102-1613(+)